MMVYESKHDMPGKRASPWCIAVALWSCVLACTIGSNMTLIDDGNDRGYMDAVTGILIMKSGPHSPITITNDTELEDFILAEGLQGNGTVGNPFVIRDFEINAGGTGKCLVLANITRYLTIVNCTFSNAGDNTVDGRNCSNINFTENRVIGNVQYNKYPVFFWRLYNSTIATNNITNQPNSRGLFLSTASNVTIEGNRIYNNDSGMQVSNCNNVRIYSNMVFDNDQHNIELYSSATNIEVAHNWLNNTSHYGIYVYQYASYCTIWNNSISHNEYENILITQYAHHITIRDNNLTDSYFGVRSDNCHYITIERNHATRNHHGFVLIAADYCRVVGNNASYNNYNGIVMEDLGGGASCNHNVVRLNTLVGNPTNNFQYSTAGINNSLYDLWYGNYYGNYLSQNPSATSDGVTWNLPYTTGGTVTAIDHHPLAVPYGSIPIVADVAKSTTGSIKAGQPITFYTMGYAGDPESTFQWNFGDGTSNATTRDATHVYQDAGTFTVRLTIVARSFMIFAVGPLIASFPTMGETKQASPFLFDMMARISRMARIGSIDKYGFDGAMTILSVFSSASRTSGVILAWSAPENAISSATGPARSLTKYSSNSSHLSPERTLVRTSSSVHGRTSAFTPWAARMVRATSVSLAPSSSRLVLNTCVPMSLSPKLNHA